MATIIREPDFIDLATGPVIWSLDNIGTAERFVLQVEIEGTIAATIRQTPNAAGTTHFDIQEILRQNLDAIHIEETIKATGVEGSALRYRVRFGTETAGTQIFTAFSDFKVVLNGYKRYDEIDWADRLDYVAEPITQTCLSGLSTIIIKKTSFLTNSPVTELRSDDYYTLSLVNFHRPPLVPNINATPWAVLIILFDADDNTLDKVIYTLKEPLIGPRDTCTDTLIPLLDKDQVLHIGVGPENLRGLSPAVDIDNTAKIIVRVMAIDPCAEPPISDCDDPDEINNYLGTIWAEREFTIVNDCTKFEPIQLSFQNQFGATDYYTFIRRNEREDRIRRTEYLRDPGSWNSEIFDIDTFERGSTVISSAIQSEINISTDWVDDETALWFRELFLSPNIKAYYEDRWVPVVSLSQTYEEKSHARNDKLYRYDIRLRLANNIRVQR